MTPYTPEEIALARYQASRLLPDKVLEEALNRYNQDATQSSFEHHLIRVAGEFAALAAIRATTERAEKLAEPCDFDNGWGEYIANELRTNEHLKDRPDAG